MTIISGGNIISGGTIIEGGNVISGGVVISGGNVMPRPKAAEPVEDKLDAPAEDKAAPAKKPRKKAAAKKAG